MTNWERYFGTPERAACTEVQFVPWPFMVVVYEARRMGNCSVEHRLLARFYEEAEYLEWLKAEHDDGTIKWEEE